MHGFGPQRHSLEASDELATDVKPITSSRWDRTLENTLTVAT